MNGPGDRLRALSESAGYESLSEFARASGVEESTMRQHIARDSVPKGAAALYIAKAKKTGATVEWLLYGKGKAPEGVEPTHRPVAERRRRAPDDESVVVYQVDTGSMAGMGRDDGEVHVAANDAVGIYTFPSAGFRQIYGALPESVVIDEVRGDSMQGTLWPGQRVMVDLRDRKPSPPGIFMVWDGMGMVLKRVELVPGSDPPTIRLTSDNPKYATYERTVDEAQICGRVIGLWTRL